MLDQKDKVSVIIPVYNGAKFIEQTIQFIQRSSYSNLEVLLVNDGSTDNSAAIIEKLAQTDERIILFTKENGGVVSARNYGVDKATGEFICFCDQDDIVMEDMYLRLCEKMQLDESDIGICSSGRSIDGKRSLLDISEDAIYAGEDINESIIFPLVFNGFKVPVNMKNTSRYPHIWHCMFRADFWRKHNLKFRAYVNYEDDLLLKVEALCKAERISTISYVGYYWRINLRSETYAHKYVEDIGKKQQQMLLDIITSVSYRIKDQEILKLLRKVILCKQFLDAIHNLTSPYKKKNILVIRNYYKENIYSRKFKEAMEVRGMIKKGWIKPSVLLPILAHRWTIVSYVMELVLDRVLLITLRSQTLTKLERRIKKSALGRN